MIGDVQAACGIHGNAQGTKELSSRRGSPVPAEAPSARAGYRTDDARAVDLADAMVTHLGERDIPETVNRQLTRLSDRGAGGRAPVACRGLNACASQGVDDSFPAYPPNAVVQLVDDVQVPVRVRGHRIGTIQAGAGRRAAVAAKTRGFVAGHGLDGCTGRTCAISDDCHGDAVRGDSTDAHDDRHGVARGGIGGRLRVDLVESHEARR